MLFIVLFGALFSFFCLMMIVSPGRFSEGIISFSNKQYFHLFEIVLRIAFGILFIVFASSTSYPQVYSVFGYLLVFAGLFLILLRPKLHIKFAVWAANNFRKYFRFLGILFLPIGIAIIYGAIR